MKAYIWLCAAFFFATCMFTHVLLWRMRQPRRHILSLYFIFFLLPLFILGVFMIAYVISGIGEGVFEKTSFMDWGFILLLHFSLSSAYILTYPAAQAVSPSLKILVVLKGQGPSGLTYEQIRSYFSEKDIFQSRLDDLLREGLIRQENGRFSVANNGILMVRMFVFYRKMLGLPMGGG